MKGNHIAFKTITANAHTLEYQQHEQQIREHQQCSSNITSSKMAFKTTNNKSKTIKTHITHINNKKEHQQMTGHLTHYNTEPTS